MPLHNIAVGYRGPYSGMNNWRDAYLLSPQEAQLAQNVSLVSGAIKGLEDLGNPVTAPSIGASDEWIHYAGGSRWLSAGDRRWAMNDGNMTYFTRTAQTPQVATPSVITDLGIKPPSAIKFGASRNGGSIPPNYHQWGVTFMTEDGQESNMQPYTLALDPVNTFAPNTVTNFAFIIYLPASLDPRVTKRRIWRTSSTSPSAGGIFYLVGVVENNIDQYQFKDYFSDVDLQAGTYLDPKWLVNGVSPQLTWAPGGYPKQPWESSKLYIDDHSPAPILNVLSNTLHSVTGGGGVSGGGIVFGAADDVAYWSRLGYPNYWPLLNNQPLAYKVQAIATGAGLTYYFTTHAIYQVMGVSDDALAWTKTRSTFGVRDGCGHSVVPVLSGFIFLAREGLAYFDGTESHIISTGQISISYLLGLNVTGAAYFDNQYILFHSSGILICDLHEGIQSPRYHISDMTVLAAHSTDFIEPIVASGLMGMGTPHRFVASCSDGSGRIYIAGGTFDQAYGTNAPGAQGSARIGEVPSNNFGWYDTANRLWNTSMNAAPKDNAGNPATPASIPGNLFILDSGLVHIKISGTDYVFLLGGATDPLNPSETNINYAYNVSTNAWDTTHTAVPTNTQGPAVATDGTYLYLFGGINGSGAVQAHLYRYDPVAKTWLDLGASPYGGRSYASMVYLGGKLYIIGGSDGSIAHSDVLIYNVAGASWTQDNTGAALGFMARYRSVADVYNGKIYVFGGTIDGSAILSDLWEYNPGGNPTWSASVGQVINAMGRQAYAGGIVGSFFYTACGQTTLGTFSQDGVKFDLSNLIDNNPTPGLYVLQAADAGHIRQWRASATPRLWTWKTGEFVGDSETPYKTYTRLRMDAVGSIDVKASIDGGAPFLVTSITGASRGVPQLLWLPNGSDPKAICGHRLAFQFEAKSTNAELHFCAVEGYQDV